MVCLGTWKLAAPGALTAAMEPAAEPAVEPAAVPTAELVAGLGDSAGLAGAGSTPRWSRSPLTPL